jgi:FkbM family methyltransferase
VGETPATADATRAVDLLGAAARAARAAGLARPLRAATRAADLPFVLARRPPLRAELRGLPFRGYLRHRSFLATDVRPETSYCELFEDSLRPGLTVVDGGAHLGAYAVLAARTVRCAAVLAFEPDPYNFRALAYNTRRLAPEVRLSRKALAGTAGRVAFHLSSSTIGSSLFRRGDTRRVVDVETTTLDRELADLDLSGGLLAKLNVEGAEPLVLAGMRETLARVENVTLFLEVSPTLLAAAGTDITALVRDLERDRVRVFWIDVARRTIIPVERADISRRGHLYCVRAGSSR